MRYINDKFLNYRDYVTETGVSNVAAYHLYCYEYVTELTNLPKENTSVEVDRLKYKLEKSEHKVMELERLLRNLESDYNILEEQYIELNAIILNRSSSRVMELESLLNNLKTDYAVFKEQYMELRNLLDTRDLEVKKLWNAYTSVCQKHSDIRLNYNVLKEKLSTCNNEMTDIITKYDAEIGYDWDH